MTQKPEIRLDYGIFSSRFLQSPKHPLFGSRAQYTGDKEGASSSDGRRFYIEAYFAKARHAVSCWQTDIPLILIAKPIVVAIKIVSDRKRPDASVGPKGTSPKF